MEDFEGKNDHTALITSQFPTWKPRHKKKRKHHHHQPSLQAAGTSVLSSSLDEEDEKVWTYCEWDCEGLSGNMEFVSGFSSTKIRRQIAAQSTDGAMCRLGYQRGQHEFLFEFTQKLGSHCTVGLSKKDCVLYMPGYVHLLGQDSLSWAFDIPSGQLFHQGQVVGSVESFTKSGFKPKIGMEIDFEAGCLTFRILRGRSCRSCTYVSEELCQPLEPLYPVISMVYGLAECTVRRLSHHGGTTLEQTKMVEVGNCQLCQDTSPLESKTLVLSRVKKAGPDDQNSFRSASNFGYLDRSVMTSSIPRTTVAAVKDEMEQTCAAEAEEVSEDSFCISNAVKHSTNEKIRQMMVEQKYNKELIVELGDWNARSENHCGEEELLAVSELSEQNRLVIESFHGWDNISRGGLVIPHPGAPSICVPAPRLSGGVQAIRSKQGFVSGRHRWMIRQLRFYVKKDADGTTAAANDIFAGVVSAEHSVFNYGYALSNVGPFAWCYQPTTKTFWHGSSFRKLKDCVDDDSTFGSDDLELELDLDQQTLTYFSSGKAVATLCHVRGKQIYPFIIFHKDAHFPVQVLYTKGPADYLASVLKNVAEPEKMISIFNHQPQLLRSSSLYLTDFREQSRMNSFHWGHVSPGIRKNPLNVAQMSSSFTKPAILTSACSLSGNIHKVQWTVEAENTADLILGLVAEEFDVGSFAQEMSVNDSARFLGDSTLSWGWNVMGRKLFHAGHTIAAYPIFADIDCEAFNIYRMTICYVSTKCSSVSFEIVPKKSSDHTIDLGMAFLNVPANVRPAVMIRPPTQKRMKSVTTRVTMEYYSGSWIPAGKHLQSSFCSIL